MYFLYNVHFSTIGTKDKQEPEKTQHTLTLSNKIALATYYDINITNF